MRSPLAFRDPQLSVACTEAVRGTVLDPQCTVADGINLTGFLPLSKMFGKKNRKNPEILG
jgi:hypothetical protein